MKPTVYIFRGAPASGKGTIVPKFCELLPKPVAFISQDDLRWGFHLIGRKVSDVKDSEHMLAYKNTELLYEQYLKDGSYTIVLEGLFTWDDQKSSQGNAKSLVELARKHGFDVKSIVLRADKDELLARNAARGYTVPREEFEDLYHNVYKKIGDGEEVIDSTRQTPEQTMAALAVIK